MSAIKPKKIIPAGPTPKSTSPKKTQPAQSPKKPRAPKPKPKNQGPLKAGFVTVLGRPNSGKSSLINRILKQELSIVTPKAQTTRDKVLGILSIGRGQIVFLDTPGIHKAKENSINQFMVKEATSSIHDAEVIWYLVSPDSNLKAEMAVIEIFEKLIETKKLGPSTHVFCILNKSDLFRHGELFQSRAEKLHEEVLQKVIEIGLKAEGRQLSVHKNRGVEELEEETWALLPDGEPIFEDLDAASDRPVRFFVAEKIREQLLLQLGDEIPYSCGVDIERFEENKKPVRIEAIIYVERDSQKGMVVGKGGQKIKAIGTAARAKIEIMLDQQIFLGLKVKVLKEWTRDPALMKRLGYSL
jgi:GTP-binding protein Era